MSTRRLLVLFLEYFVFTKTEVVRSSYYDVKKNTFFSNPPLDILSARSMLDCTKVCLSKECRTVGYLAEEKKCYLSNDSCEPSINAPGYSLMTVPERTFLYVSNVKRTWADAKIYCQSLGGQLARIYTSCENERVKKLTPQTSPVWIDGTDVDNEGIWLFSDGLPLQGQVKFSYWGPNQPNNYGGYQHCMTIYYFSTQNVFEWADEACNAEYDFICEM